MGEKGFIRQTQQVVRNRRCRTSSKGFLIKQEPTSVDQQSQAVYHPYISLASSSVSGAWRTLCAEGFAFLLGCSFGKF